VVEKKGELKTYIITAAQNSYRCNKDGDLVPWGGGSAKAKLHKTFYQGLESCAKDLDAELIIAPIAGKNSLENVLHEDLDNNSHIFTGTNLWLNKNIQLRDIVVPPQNVDPTTGKKTLVSKYNSSLIVPHAKQRYLPVPVFNSDLPRYLYTTGAVTLPNYNVANHRGDTAERNHIFGGLVVEVIDDTYFNIRNLRALKNGKFADMGNLYNGDAAPKNIKVDSLVLGDIHWGDHDSAAIEANYEMIEHFKPSRIFLHDFFNGHSVNYHEKDNLLRKTREYGRGRLFLGDEFKQGYEELKNLSKVAGRNSQIYIISSNHHDFLPRYINSDAWRKNDIWNAEIGSYLFSKGVSLLTSENHNDDSAYLIEQGMKRHGRIPSNVNFLNLEDNLRRHGYQLASHGHKGGHGSRGGSAKARSVTGGGKSITGHSHSMEIFGDTYIVGTSSQLDLPYTAGGGSAWIAANAVLYSNGTVQMLPSVKGKWKAKR
jgi:hypothetical protein